MLHHVHVMYKVRTNTYIFSNELKVIQEPRHHIIRRIFGFVLNGNADVQI